MRGPGSPRREFLKHGRGVAQGVPALSAISASSGRILGQAEGGSGSLALLLEVAPLEVQHFQRAVGQLQEQDSGTTVAVGYLADVSAFCAKVSTERPPRTFRMSGTRARSTSRMKPQEGESLDSYTAKPSD